jgi:hypothetical protein
MDLRIGIRRVPCATRPRRGTRFHLQRASYAVASKASGQGSAVAFLTQLRLRLPPGWLEFRVHRGDRAAGGTR